MGIGLGFEVVELCLLFFDAQLLGSSAQFLVIINMTENPKKENGTHGIPKLVGDSLHDVAVLT